MDGPGQAAQAAEKASNCLTATQFPQIERVNVVAGRPFWLGLPRNRSSPLRSTKEGLALSAEAHRTPADRPYPSTLFERLRLLRDCVAAEGNAILQSADSLSDQAVRAAEMTADCSGCVLVTGVGKAGLGRSESWWRHWPAQARPRIFFIPSEAVHGDLGRVRECDLVWAISNSGRSEEVVRIALAPAGEREWVDRDHGQ